MPTAFNVNRHEKLADISSERKAAFERKIPWKRICEVFELSHKDAEGDDGGVTVACPNCELDGTQTLVPLSSVYTMFKCPECGTKDSKFDFMSGCFSHDPAVSDATRLFGKDCFD